MDDTQGNEQMSDELGVPALDLGGDAYDSLSGMRVLADGKVVEGRDGFLFMANDNNEVLAQHTGRLRLSAEELEGWRVALESRTALLAQRGCAHLVLIAPNNHSVYPEKLPPDIETAPQRPVHQLMDHLDRKDSPVKVIYPLQEMLAAKEEQLVCSRVDSHWTDYGAFLAYLRLMEEAHPLVPTRRVGMDDVLFVDVVVAGDLGGKFDPPREAPQAFGRMRYRNARLIYDNLVEGTGALAVTDCDVAPPTTCLVLGDSNSYVLARFLSECWQRLVLAHSSTLDHTLVETVQPDIVVSVLAERFLISVPDDTGGRSMKEREQIKRNADRTRHPLLHWTWPTLLSASPVEVMRARLVAEGRTRDAALVGVLAYAGLRPAEAMALRWSAIGEHSIHVEPLPRRRDAGGVARTVPLWKPLAEDLEAWRRESGGEGRQLVFSAPDKPWRLDLRHWRDHTYPELARDAGIKSRLPSFLRHVFCVLMINGGAGLHEVAASVDSDPAEVEETFRGLLSDARRTGSRPPDQAIAEARAATAREADPARRRGVD